MAVREFAGGAYVQWSIGSLATLPNGAWTMAAICRRFTHEIFGNPEMAPFLSLEASSNPRLMSRFTDADEIASFGNGFQSASSGISWTEADDWVLVAVTKASGDTVIRGHKIVLGGSATHANSAGTIENDPTTCTFASTRWAGDGDWAFRGRMAVMAAWNSALSDGDLEALVSLYADWVAASPVALWRFDQASTAAAIDDQIGTADQTTLSGSSVITDDDPPGFSFEDPGGAVELDGTSDSAARHAGTLATTRLVAGASLAAAEHVGGLAATRTVTGQADVASEHAADLTTARGLDGTADGAADASGGIQVARGADGSSEAAAEMTGSLTLTLTLAGAVDVAGEHGGTLTAARSLAGAADAAAQHLADLAIAGQVTLTGTMDVAAQHSGTVTAARSLTATTEAAAEHAGDLTVTEPGIVGLAGTTDAAAVLTGQLSTFRLLTGTSDAAAEHVGQLVPISAGGTASMVAAETPTAAGIAGRVPFLTAVAPRVPTAGGVA